MKKIQKFNDLTIPQYRHKGADKKNSELREAAGGEAVGLEIIFFRRSTFVFLLAFHSKS